MQDKLHAIEERFEHLAAEMADPDVLGDHARYQAASKAYSEIEPVVEVIRKRRECARALEEARQLRSETGGDREMAELVRQEIEDRESELEKLERELEVLLVPKDPNDEKNVLVEVRAGTGGDEATLFAAELLRSYLRYAEGRGWKTRIVSSSESGAGGIKEAIVEVAGKGAWSRLKHESGVHRVQRVPVTEASGRIHTSAASVAVLPEADEVEVEIAENDLRVDLYCSSGPGGQSVNTTQSAVRLTHLPTGIVVQCQDQKSQHANKASALTVLRSRLLEARQREQHEAIAAERKGQVGSGDRSEKIRTYNFPQSRVTDHRVPVTVHRIDDVMNGGLDLILDPVVEHFQAESLKGE